MATTTSNVAFTAYRFELILLMYCVLGEAVIYKRRASDGVHEEVGRSTRSSYCGQAALLLDGGKHAAKMLAEGCLTCVYSPAAVFRRLVKPVIDFLEMAADAYHSLSHLVV
ncbi:unnamed protein product [Rotaria sordida]|uniref:Uncharacterized protein n=1 Tax=Rotaria sordida TaxID=392033 RepID=A0A814PVY6_9BILA|nr:unnamed protein product [Rotaria sordida]